MREFLIYACHIKIGPIVLMMPTDDIVCVNCNADGGGVVCSQEFHFLGSWNWATFNVMKRVMVGPALPVRHWFSSGVDSSWLKWDFVNIEVYGDLFSGVEPQEQKIWSGTQMHLLCLEFPQYCHCPYRLYLVYAITLLSIKNVPSACYSYC